VVSAVAVRPAVKAPPIKRAAQGRDGRRDLDPDHDAYAEVGLLDPAGAGTASYEILPGMATRLTAHVTRLTAPNSGMMTGPGTNSYLVGQGSTVAVIDPGPAIEGHLQKLIDLAQGRIGWILVTHTHQDHSPGAAFLKERTGALLLGRAAPAGIGQDTSFVPDIVFGHGQQVQLDGCALRAIHTPGHASNHLCYLLEEDRLLFTGDHVMQGSTVVINPPDGDMAAYLESLRMLRNETMAYFAPGHGFLIGDPPDMIDRLLRHRLFRENKALGVVRALGPASLETLTPVVYDDVPPFKHAVAARSLLAHLLKLAGDGIAQERDGLWLAR